jgi:hypothetical protein
VIASSPRASGNHSTETRTAARHIDEHAHMWRLKFENRWKHQVARHDHSVVSGQCHRSNASQGTDFVPISGQQCSLHRSLEDRGSQRIFVGIKAFGDFLVRDASDLCCIAQEEFEVSCSSPLDMRSDSRQMGTQIR